MVLFFMTGFAQGQHSPEELFFGQTTPLHKAAEIGDLKEVTRLVDSGAKMDVLDEAGRMPIHIAVYKRWNDVVRLFIARGVPVDARSGYGQTPLFDVRTVEMTKLLLLCSADVNAKTKDGYTPLHEAVNADIAALLIKKNAEINAKDISGRTPLHMASARLHFDLIELLLISGAKVNERTLDGSTPLDLCLKINLPDKSRIEDTALTLIKSGAEIPTDEKNQTTAVLFSAAARGQKKILDYLFDHGGSIHVVNKSGKSLLHVVQDARTMLYLIALGAEVNKRDLSGRTPLHDTVFNKRKEIATELIRYGAEINAGDNNGDTPLHLASMWADYDTAKVLIQAGGEINRKNSAGLRPYDVAGMSIPDFKDRGDGYGARYWRTRPELIAFLFPDELAKEEADRLLSNTSDPFVSRIWTPLHNAVKSLHVKTIKEVLKRGVDVNEKDALGQTSLYLAITMRELEIVKLLIDNGARCDIMDNNEVTPMYVAQIAGDSDIIEYLQQKCPTR